MLLLIFNRTAIVDCSGLRKAQPICSLSMSELIKCQEVARIREAETKYVTKAAITDVSAVEEADHGVSQEIGKNLLLSSKRIWYKS